MVSLQGDMMDERTRKVCLLQADHQQRTDEYQAWEASGFDSASRPPLRQIPDDLRCMQCEAMTRAGTPCKRTDIYANGRCKFHGGMSTGARTEEGKARQREGYRRWLEEKRRANAGTQDGGTQ